MIKSEFAPIDTFGISVQNLRMKISLGKIKGFAILVGVLLCLSSKAQNGNPMQFLSEVSQSAQVNPAFQNQTDKLVIGLPFLSGASLKWKANFSPNYIFSENFSYSFDRFYRTLGEPGDVDSEATLPVIYLSLRKNKNTFSFSLTEKFLASGNFDHEVLRFIDLGLIPYYGKEEEYGPISLRSQTYREVAFSFARKVNKRWSIGVRPKILFNKYFYDMKNMYINVQTLPDEQILQIIPNGEYQIYGPIAVTYNPIQHKTTIKTELTTSDYLFNFENLGAGIDFGFTCKLNNQTTIAFAITDLGYTTLGHRSYNNTLSGSIDYLKENLYQSNNPDAPNYFEPKEALLALTDSLPYVTSTKVFTRRQYEMLPVKLNMMVTHSLNDRMKLNFSDNLTFQNEKTNNYLSAYFNILLGNSLELSSGINIYNFEQILPGLACSYTGKSAQFFLATNNIVKLIQPYKAKNLNLRFGVNFLFSTQPK